MHDPKMVEMVGYIIEEAYANGCNDGGDVIAKRLLDALAAAGRLVPEGWVAVPREPTDGLLMSMALRADHGLACPGYYDQTLLGGTPGQHTRRLEVAISDARRMHEEVIGSGFYNPEKEAEYRAMLAAAPRAEDAA